MRDLVILLILAVVGFLVWRAAAGAAGGRRGPGRALSRMASGLEALSPLPRDASAAGSLAVWQRRLFEGVSGAVRKTWGGVRELPTSITVDVNAAGHKRLTADLGTVRRELVAELERLAHEYGTPFLAPVLYIRLDPSLADYEVVVSVDYADRTVSGNEDGNGSTRTVEMPPGPGDDGGLMGVLTDEFGRRTPLTAGRKVTVGRAQDRDIVLEDAGKGRQAVSRHHLTVTGGNGGLATAVSKGLNGTKVLASDGSTRDVGAGTRLQDGDTLVLAGVSRLRFSVESAGTSAPAGARATYSPFRAGR